MMRGPRGYLLSCIRLQQCMKVDTFIGLPPAGCMKVDTFAGGRPPAPCKCILFQMLRIAAFPSCMKVDTLCM